MTTTALMSNRSSACRRLILHLSQAGDPGRVLEFATSNDRAYVLGSSKSADVVVQVAGVNSVHCYFEREGDELWVAPAGEHARISLNAQAVPKRARLRANDVLDVGPVRFQIAISEMENCAPKFGPTGTEIIPRTAFPAPEECFETEQFDMRAALGNPTASLDTRRLWDPNLTSTTKMDRATWAIELDASERAKSAGTSSRGGITQPIPVPQLASPSAPPITVVPASPSVLVEARTGLVPIHDGEQSSPWEENASTQPAPGASASVPPRTCEALDLANLATTHRPIAEIFPAPPPQESAPQPVIHEKPRFAGAFKSRARLRLIVGAVILVTSTASIIALRACLATASIEHSGSARTTKAPTRVTREAMSETASHTAQPIRESVVPDEIASDPLVSDATGHLFAGRNAEATVAYEALAARYRHVPTFEAIAKVLKRKKSHPSKAR